MGSREGASGDGGSRFADPESPADPLPPEADAVETPVEPSRDADIAPEAQRLVSRASGAREAAPALPPRLQTAAWVKHVATASEDGRALDVPMGDGSRIRLRARRSDDGLQVHLRFSDPDTLALAHAHAHDLADAIRAELGEDVTLRFGAPLADDSPRDEHTETPESQAPLAPEAETASDPTPVSIRATLREWIG